MPRSSFLSAFAQGVSTWWVCGRSPVAPGTAGSASALVFFPLVVSSAACGALLVVVTFALGLWAVARYLEDNPERHDPAEVVVDEVCGQTLVLTIPCILTQRGVFGVHLPSDALHQTIFLCSGLVCFRIFDVAKPWPVCIVDARVGGALGVMLDDIVAAIPASIVCLAMVNASFM
ncbi:MAG: phosphatidylglycerophosphatase A [Anaplasma ovis]|uniref:Phosphatidylglycerophosphatase A n=1 Tax=Anaplasma ovis str. Haibei TaxID=1248439 RepID=A0A2Z2LCH7_9RICK|nr:phosphatidylglycerophosphatase A [Anaplasma ovis str. Haibei]